MNNAANAIGAGSGGVVNAAGYGSGGSTNQADAAFAKQGNKNWLLISTTDRVPATSNSWVNLNTGATGTVSANHVIKLWPVANGFYRVEVRIVSSGAGSSTLTTTIAPADADNTLTCTGDGATVNAWIWGVQHQQNDPWPSSYIATTTASVSRVADSAPTRAHGSIPQSRTLYIDMTEIGSALTGGNGFMLQMGSNLNGMSIRNAGTGANNYGILYNNSTAALGGPLSGNPAVGQEIELRVAAGNVGDATGGQSLDRGAETTATNTTASPYPIAYGTANYALGFTLVAPLAIRSFKDVLGPQSMACHEELLMRSTLSIAPTIPVNADLTPDGRFKVLRQFGAAADLQRAIPNPRPAAGRGPANATLVLHDGATDWSWGDLLTGHPALQALVLFAHWREADGFHIGTKAQMALRGAAVLQTYLTDAPPHMWFGDPP